MGSPVEGTARGRWNHSGRCHGGLGTPNEDRDFEELFQVWLCLMCVGGNIYACVSMEVCI